MKRKKKCGRDQQLTIKNVDKNQQLTMNY